MTLVSKTIHSTHNLPIIHDDTSLSRSEFVQFNDTRSWVTKIAHLVLALFDDIRFGLQYRYNAYTLENRIKKQVFWHPTAPGVTEWNKKSSGAAFFLHGIGGQPQIWTNQVEYISTANPEMDIRAFYIPKKGSCGNQEAILDIVNVIRDYAKKNPGSLITLYGVSNGARLLLHLDEALADLENTPIYFQSIAGPHFGTIMMDLTEKVWTIFGRHKDAIEELKLNSKKEIIQRLRDRKTMPLRKYDFYATECDPQVRTSLFHNVHTTALPIIGKGETHVLLKGDMLAGHSSIVERVCTLQVDRMNTWLKSHFEN